MRVIYIDYLKAVLLLLHCRLFSLISTNASNLFYKCSDLTNLAAGDLTLSLNLVTDFAYGLAGRLNLSYRH